MNENSILITKLNSGLNSGLNFGLNSDLNSVSSFNLNPNLNPGLDSVKSSNSPYNKIDLSIEKSNTIPREFSTIKSNESVVIATNIQNSKCHDFNFRLQKNATLYFFFYAKGDNDLKLNITVDFLNSNSSVFIQGVNESSKNAKRYFECKINHNSKNCNSFLNCVNIISSSNSLTSFLGKTDIKKGATGSDAFLQIKNYLLAPNAQCIALPELNIKEGNIVRAGHKATTSSFEKGLLFYIKSRGISESKAREMLVDGIKKEIFSKISDNGIKKIMAEYYGSKIIGNEGLEK